MSEMQYVTDTQIIVCGGNADGKNLKGIRNFNRCVIIDGGTN